MEIRIDADRIGAELDTLAGFSETPAPAVTRIVFTRPDLAARAWLKGLLLEAGLQVREDAIGNTFARWPGTGDGVIGTGSHIDAIPNSGRYDGTVGVLGGLEAIRALQRAEFRPRRSIELLLFTSEEPTRFGIGCLGSRVLSGALGATAASALTDNESKSLDTVRAAVGFQGSLEEVKLPKDYYSGFIELHIEQGPLLERSGTPLGIVTNIAAPAGMKISVKGEGGHAGAVLMPQRRDALVGASEIMLGIEAAALSTAISDTVATTGSCVVFPGAVNSIPSEVNLGVDVRDIDDGRRDSVIAAIRNCCEEVAAKRGLQIEVQLLNADAPAACDARLISTLQGCCATLGLNYMSMVSRAYHDSLFMARIAPVAMLFIPCRNGVSHRPDEYAAPEDIARGTLLLAHALAELAG